MTLIMLGLSLSNDSLFCLGIMFILIGILFFYIKKQISHLETAQLEQAKLLQSIIMSLNNGQVMVPQSMGGGTMSNINIQEENTNENSLIDVSDGEEESDHESDEEDSDDASENSSDSEVSHEELEEYNENVEKSINDIDEDSVVNISNNDDVKVISLSNTLEDPEEITIDENSLSDDDDDDDEDDEGDEEDDSVSMSAIDGLAKSSLKTLKVGDLRKMVAEKGLHEDPSKVKKNELIELLEQQ